MKEQEKINSLIATCYNAAKAKGFWDEPRNQDEAFALILSELFEAFEGHRKGKFSDMKQFLELTKNGEFDFENSPITTNHFFQTCIKDTFGDEIADTFVRLFDYFGGFGFGLHYAKIDKVILDEVITDNFGQTIHKILSVIYRNYSPVYSPQFLYNILLDIVEKYSIDIERHIELKLKYNSLRPYKHGKQY